MVRFILLITSITIFFAVGFIYERAYFFHLKNGFFSKIDYLLVESDLNQSLTINNHFNWIFMNKEETAQEPTLVWYDEFNYEGVPDPFKWKQEFFPGWNNQSQFYTKTNAIVNGSCLIINTRKEIFKNKNYTSSRLQSNINMTYGIIEMRAKLPKGNGTFPAFWLSSVQRSEKNLPLNGEIDIMEHVGHKPGTIHATVWTFKEGGNTKNFSTIKISDPFDNFHVYKLDWNAERLIFYVDEYVYLIYKNLGISSDQYPFDGPMRLILNTAIGGNWAGVVPTDDKALPAQFVIDYVRQYV